MAELNLGRVKGDQGPQGEPGIDGEQGLPGEAGSDAVYFSVAPSSIAVNESEAIDKEIKITTVHFKGNNLGYGNQMSVDAVYVLRDEDYVTIPYTATATYYGYNIFVNTSDLQDNDYILIFANSVYQASRIELMIPYNVLVAVKGDKGEQGETGESAYEVAVRLGFIGTEEEWRDSLQGPQGERGLQGEQGEQGIQGEQGLDGGATIIITDDISTTPTQTIETNTEYRFTSAAITTIEITIPAFLEEDFISSVVWANPETTATLTITNNSGLTLKYSGSDVDTNVFTPVESKTYNMMFFNDGININCMIRGV